MRRSLRATVACLLLYGCLWLRPASGQSGSSAEWPTNGNDPQRSGWQKNETKISPASVKNFQLLWTYKTDNKPMALAGLLQPLILSGVSTPGGAKTLVVVAGSSDTLTAIDLDTGDMVWHRNFVWLSDDPQTDTPPRGFICENAETASPVANASGSNPRLVYTLTVDGYLHTVNAATGEEVGKPIQTTPHAYAKANGLNL